MARYKADKPAYENKAEQLDNPTRVLIEVIRPHDGLGKGYQAYKPYQAAKQMVDLGYWRIVID
jgi:hypothetical protein